MKSNTESGRGREKRKEGRVGEKETLIHTQVFALGLTDKRINAIKFFPCFSFYSAVSPGRCHLQMNMSDLGVHKKNKNGESN